MVMDKNAAEHIQCSITTRAPARAPVPEAKVSISLPQHHWLASVREELAQEGTPVWQGNIKLLLPCWEMGSMMVEV